MWNQKPSFRFEIDNFSGLQACKRKSQVFVGGGYEWVINFFPKGAKNSDDHLSLYLQVANSNSLGSGWKRNVRFYFSLLNQSVKELYRSPIGRVMYEGKSISWGFRKAMPLSKFQEIGFLEKDRLIIEVYINIIEACDGAIIGYVSENKKETVDINGFQVLASQATMVKKIFEKHPEFALDFKRKNKVVKTRYMNVLLDLINTLNKPWLNLSETEQIKVYNDLDDLIEVGFNLDWLNSRFEEISLETQKAHLEAMDSVMKRLQHLTEKTEAKDDDIRFKILEERVKNLESNLESDDDDDEERIKNLEMTMADLKVEFDKEKEAKTCPNGFLLV